jgi:hypothetical protein
VKPTSNSRKHQPCTRPIALELSYALNIAANVTFTLSRQEPGRKDHGVCLKVTPWNAKHARCTRLSSQPGALTHASSVGSNTFTFDDHIGKTPAACSYLLTATPIANGYPGIPQSVTVKLIS